MMDIIRDIVNAKTSEEVEQAISQFVGEFSNPEDISKESVESKMMSNRNDDYYLFIQTNSEAIFKKLNLLKQSDSTAPINVVSGLIFSVVSEIYDAARCEKNIHSLKILGDALRGAKNKINDEMSKSSLSLFNVEVVESEEENRLLKLMKERNIKTELNRKKLNDIAAKKEPLPAMKLTNQQVIKDLDEKLEEKYEIKRAKEEVLEKLLPEIKKQKLERQKMVSQILEAPSDLYYTNLRLREIDNKQMRALISQEVETIKKILQLKEKQDLQLQIRNFHEKAVQSELKKVFLKSKIEQDTVLQEMEKEIENTEGINVNTFKEVKSLFIKPDFSKEKETDEKLLETTKEVEELKRALSTIHNNIEKNDDNPIKLEKINLEKYDSNLMKLEKTKEELTQLLENMQKEQKEINDELLKIKEEKELEIEAEEAKEMEDEEVEVTFAVRNLDEEQVDDEVEKEAKELTLALKDIEKNEVKIRKELDEIGENIENLISQLVLAKRISDEIDKESEELESNKDQLEEEIKKLREECEQAEALCLKKQPEEEKRNQKIVLKLQEAFSVLNSIESKVADFVGKIKDQPGTIVQDVVNDFSSAILKAVSIINEDAKGDNVIPAKMREDIITHFSEILLEEKVSTLLNQYEPGRQLISNLKSLTSNTWGWWIASPVVSVVSVASAVSSLFYNPFRGGASQAQPAPEQEKQHQPLSPTV
ncbi:MAG: hypothetical protein EPO11_10820 [Gammaproteobacteria bacterium]|nr:MAG: hypothetical protein EPO11_10820 [Gammaproteobacteria bacterium]